MLRQRVNVTEITAGKPLLWDVFDSQGRLLLSRGSVIEDDDQVENLICRGAFFEAASQPKIEAKREPPSALRAVNLASQRLVNLLSVENEFPQAVCEIAKTLMQGAKINPDVVAACVLLNRTAQHPQQHAIDTASIALLVAKAMQMEEEKILPILSAALTMDIAYFGGGAKSAELAKTHPQEGIKILENKGVKNREWLDCIAAHHEREDGSGFPSGLKGSQIPLGAKIIAAAGIYCAKISGLGQKAALPCVALREVFLGKESNHSLAPSFIKALGLYPPGAFVRIGSGEIGVVSKVGDTPTTPFVHALVGPRGAPLSYAIKRDTGKSSYAIRESVPMNDIRFSMRQVWAEDADL